MAHIRILTNARVTVHTATGAKELEIKSGKFMRIEKLIDNLDGTMDLCLINGDVIPGVERTFFSAQGTPKIEIAQVEESRIAELLDEEEVVTASINLPLVAKTLVVEPPPVVTESPDEEEPPFDVDVDDN